MVEELTITETPATTDKNSVSIDETPLEIPETPLKTSVTFDEAAAPAPIPADVVALEPKRKPGRPPGSKNREQGKPRKPRAKAVAVPIREEPVEPPPPLPGSRPIPTEARDSREALMLRLLSQQANARQQNKVAMWKSWFL